MPHSDADLTRATGSAGAQGGLSQARCPVKDIAHTSQHLIEALQAAEDEKEKKHDQSDREAVYQVLAAERRYDALWELISYKKEQAATTLALSAGGAAHQIAVASELIERIWETTPERSENAEAYRIARDAHGLLNWCLYSVLNVLLSLESEPQDRLAIEFYMAKDGSPFALTATDQQEVA